MNINEKLMTVQSKLKAPKGQYNSFGKYNYRNCEDILEALKPLLLEVEATINISDEVVLIGERYYIKATAELLDTVITDGEYRCVEAVGWAREADDKKGMDASQVTGSTSSYARKYALNGLFAIDDTKDSDATNQHSKSEPTKAQGNSNAIKDTLQPSPQRANAAPTSPVAGLITPPQQAKLQIAVKENNIPVGTVKAEIAKLGKDSSTKLTTAEASKMIAWAQAYKPEPIDEDWENLGNFVMPEEG